MTTTTFKLTEDQAKAITKMKEFCAYPEHKFFRLTGYAGTGKSYLICQLIKWLQDNNYKVIAASPTNKAAKNLENIASEAGIALNVTTVAKLLGQQAVLNEQTGKEEFISQGSEAIDTYDVIIIDEFSMVNIDNFVDIKIEVEDSNKTKVIFVGDSAQLPPVNENEPIVASHPDITCHANLSTVVRYDGELAKVAEKVRSDRAYRQTIYPFITVSDRTIVCLDRYEWLQAAVKLFKSDEFKVNPNYVRFLVWRNKQADILNAYVRNSLWGEDVSAYVPGDRLIAKLPVFRSVSEYTATGKRKKKNKWQIIMNSSEECEVLSEGKLTYDKTYGWQHWVVPVITDDGLRLDLRILTENGILEQKEYLRELKEARKWKAYYNALKSFD
nr:AAA family ATPase [Xenococcaceae cyanobacterium MO_188.B32]